MLPVQPEWVRTWLTCCCVVKTELTPLVVHPAGTEPSASLSKLSESSTPGAPGVGIGSGDGLGSGDGVTPGVGDGDGDGDADGLGDGDGVTTGDGEGLEVGEGAGAGLGSGCPAIHAL